MLRSFCRKLTFHFSGCPGLTAKDYAGRSSGVTCNLREMEVFIVTNVLIRQMRNQAAHRYKAATKSNQRRKKVAIPIKREP